MHQVVCGRKALWNHAAHEGSDEKCRSGEYVNMLVARVGVEHLESFDLPAAVRLSVMDRLALLGSTKAVAGGEQFSGRA